MLIPLSSDFLVTKWASKECESCDELYKMQMAWCGCSLFNTGKMFEGKESGNGLVEEERELSKSSTNKVLGYIPRQLLPFTFYGLQWNFLYMFER